MVKLLPGHCWWLSHDSHGPEIHIASIIHQPVYTYVTHTKKKTGDSLKVYIKYVYIYIPHYYHHVLLIFLWGKHQIL